MTTEIEYKFKLTEDALQALKKMPYLKVGIKKTERLISDYYDSLDGWLRQHRYALRIRQTSTGFVQTLKGAGYNEGALHQREEWECSIENNKINPALIPITTIREHVQYLIDHQQLHCIFTTDFEREKYCVNYLNSQIEVAIDRGFIKAHDKQEVIFELELELLQGTLEDINAFVSQLTDAIDLTPEPYSKAKRGYKILS